MIAIIESIRDVFHSIVPDSRMWKSLREKKSKPWPAMAGHLGGVAHHPGAKRPNKRRVLGGGAEPAMTTEGACDSDSLDICNDLRKKATSIDSGQTDNSKSLCTIQYHTFL